MNKLLATACMLAIGLLSEHSLARDAAGEKVPAKLVCSEHSANPETQRAFQRDMSFARNGPQLTASYDTKNKEGSTTNFTGIVSPTGDILVTGIGSNNKGGKWVYQFSGKSAPSGDTELKGRLENTSGAVGGRDCSLIFLKPRAL